MAQVQKQFDGFHEAIKMGRFDEQAILREKRDIIREKIKDKLPGVFEKHGETCPTYKWRNQGSYELDTGVKPLSEDYDIDQGLYFEVKADDYKDPVILKKRVHEALEGHTKSVRIRRPCVTVQYQRDNEPLYHVDIAIYSAGSKNADGKDRLALGKEHSTDENRKWELSDPQALYDSICGRFDGNDLKQFRRIVRYLKRWVDENFAPTGSAAPLGIGLTLAAYDDLVPVYTDVTAGTPNDLSALHDLVGRTLGRFTWTIHEGEYVRRLIVTLPVEPYNDLFVRMTNDQMEGFEAKLTKLGDALKFARDETADPVEASKRLQKVFGNAFPVPEKQETAKRVAPPVASSSSSASDAC